MNNYAICYNLYTPHDNLEEYKGIIYNLQYKERDFDIYIDTTLECCNTFLQICKQENYDINGIYIILHNDIHMKNLWKYKTLFNICNKYEYVCLYNNTYEIGERYDDIIKDKKYPLYSLCPYKNDISICNDLINYINVDSLIIRYDQFKDFNKYKSTFLNIYKILENNNFNSLHETTIINSLFIDIILNNQVLFININNTINDKYLKSSIYKYNNIYLYNNKKYYWHINDITKSIYYKNNNYILPDKQLSTDKIDINFNNWENDIYNDIIISHICTEVKKYILGYINNIDYNNWNFNIKKMDNENVI